MKIADRDFVEMMYNSFQQAFSFIDSPKWQTERDIHVLEGLGCIKKGEFKAGENGELIKTF
jgi:hypothetical protein